jgi:6-pyruvoyltetrahydropterin/6-carboxytetrahydropterin synthase
MFIVSVETNFTASHQLTFPDGSKESLHKHNWQVAATVSRYTLEKMKIVIDFERLKSMLDGIVAELVDTAMEKNDYFRESGSSAEMLAKYVYEKLQPQLPAEVRLEAVKVAEQPGCWAKFTK